MRTALPQLVSFQISPDDHFKQALAVSKEPTPLEAMTEDDDDLRFAAHIMCSRSDQLPKYRQESRKAIAELKHRWQPVTRYLRKQQPKSTRQVTRERDIGLIGILIILLHWPDSAYAGQLIAGFPAVGYAEWCGVYPKKPARRITLDEVFEKGQGPSNRILNKIGPGANDEYITEASYKDYKKGWSSSPLKWDELRERTKGRPINLIRRFAIAQQTAISA